MYCVVSALILLELAVLYQPCANFPKHKRFTNEHLLVKSKRNVGTNFLCTFLALFNDAWRNSIYSCVDLPISLYRQRWPSSRLHYFNFIFCKWYCHFSTVNFWCKVRKMKKIWIFNAINWFLIFRLPIVQGGTFTFVVPTLAILNLAGKFHKIILSPE